MYDVFISYSFKDRQIADAICSYLEAQNLRCWYAPRDVRPGWDYRDEIMAAIGQSKCMVLIYSDASNHSDDVKNEVTAARKAKLPVLPFRLEDVEMEPVLAYYLNGVHWLDALKPPMGKRIHELYQTVSAMIDAAGANASTGTSSAPTVNLLIPAAAIAALALVLALVFPNIGKNKQNANPAEVTLSNPGIQQMESGIPKEQTEELTVDGTDPEIQTELTVDLPDSIESEDQTGLMEEPLTDSIQLAKVVNVAENTLMTNPYKADANNKVLLEEEMDEPFFGMSITRRQVKTITFLDTLKTAPDDAVDVSAQGNGKVLAWAVFAERANTIIEENPLNETTSTAIAPMDLYHVYIAAEGGVWAPENSKCLLGCLVNLTAIEFGDAFHTESVQSMFLMFAVNKSLTNLDLSCFDTSKVDSMADMFYWCAALQKLVVSEFDTSKVTSMCSMFSHCKALTELDVSKFKTQNVTRMDDMFAFCEKLEELDLSNFKTHNVQNMCRMFYKCEKMRALLVSGFNTINVQDMSFMFNGCSSLERLDLSDFETQNVEAMNGMFQHCSSLKELDVSKFDTSKVKNMEHMFCECNDLQELNLANFKTGKVTNMRHMFAENTRLETLILADWNTVKVQTMAEMFLNCYELENLDISGFETGSVTDMSHMFRNCYSLEELELDNFVTTELTNMCCMFANCKNLKRLDLSNFNTEKVTNMSSMFYGCTSLENLDISKFDTSNVTTMYCMFYNCKALTDLKMSGFNTEKVEDMRYMFANCVCARDLDVSCFDTSNVTQYDGFMDSDILINGKPWMALFS